MRTTQPPRLPGAPILGTALRYLRGPLEFFEDAAKIGSIVDLQLPFVRCFHFSNPADIEHVVMTGHRNFVKDLPLRDAAHRARRRPPHERGGTVAAQPPRRPARVPP
jgi:hypothetical protein